MVPKNLTQEALQRMQLQQKLKPAHAFVTLKCSVPQDALSVPKRNIQLAVPEKSFNFAYVLAEQQSADQSPRLVSF